MKVLITGITGFVGSHMSDYVLNFPNAKVFGSIRWRSPQDNIKHLDGNERLILMEADLLDNGSIKNLIEQAKPDYVFHFAAQSFPGASFIIPKATLITNVLGTTNLMEELLHARNRGICDPTIISVSSSEVYGMPEEHEIPIRETNPIRAANPYSISKVGHDLMSQYYYKAFGLKVITTRMFSHEGARRGEKFAISSFAYQIVQHELNCGLVENEKFVIKVGNLDSVRTYSHISDAIHAYWLAATKGKIGEVYNIGGKEACKVGDVLDILISKSTLPRELFDVQVDPLRIRPTDITLQIPDCSKFSAQTGWFPSKGVTEITDDLLSYWREYLTFKSI